MTRGELVLARGDGRSPSGGVDLAAARECRTCLYHLHVPQLVELGPVTFDVDRRAAA